MGRAASTQLTAEPACPPATLPALRTAPSPSSPYLRAARPLLHLKLPPGSEPSAAPLPGLNLLSAAAATAPGSTSLTAPSPGGAPPGSARIHPWAGTSSPAFKPPHAPQRGQSRSAQGHTRCPGVLRPEPSPALPGGTAQGPGFQQPRARLALRGSLGRSGSAPDPLGARCSPSRGAPCRALGRRPASPGPAAAPGAVQRC